MIEYGRDSWNLRECLRISYNFDGTEDYGYYSDAGSDILLEGTDSSKSNAPNAKTAGFLSKCIKGNFNNIPLHKLKPVVLVCLVVQVHLQVKIISFLLIESD